MHVMKSTPDRSSILPTLPDEPPLPTSDPALQGEPLDLDELALHWRATAKRPPMTAEEMRGADQRAQRAGVTGHWLMEQAGTAVAAAVRALLATTGRLEKAPILVLVGPGNNGGDGCVAARHLARAGLRVAVVLVAAEPRPTAPDAARNWDALAGLPNAERIHAAQPRDLQMLGNGIERAAAVVDALLGSGVHGDLREPIRSAVELVQRARAAGVPVLAVDTPTALDLTSGDPSDPAVRADVTVTFHRPKAGLLTRNGRALAGRVLVAPIGIPAEADRA
jgi:NAD(P)H-hydrate epimerase